MSNLAALIDSTPNHTLADINLNAYQLDTAPSGEFPVEAMGELGQVVQAIQALTQAPLAQCAQSVLGAVSLITQTCINVEEFHGSDCITSLFLWTVGSSGERKTASDRYALKPIKDYEAGQYVLYKMALKKWAIKKEEWDAERQRIRRMATSKEQILLQLQESGGEPEKPKEPLLIISDGSVEGIFKHLFHNFPSLGLMNSEGGTFVSGHSFKDEQKIKTIGSYSKLWDYGEYSSLLVGRDDSKLFGRRLTIHLMAQPDISLTFLTDPACLDQGILARFLVCYPQSTQGHRQTSLQQLKQNQQQYQPILDTYNARMRHLLSEVFPSDFSALQVKTLALSDEARALLCEFYNQMESSLAEDAEAKELSGFINKLPEHATRLAANLSLYHDLEADILSPQWAMAGIRLASYYLLELKRITGLANVDSISQDLEHISSWILNDWNEPNISVRAVQRRVKPSRLRKSKHIRACLNQMEADGFLVPTRQPVMVEGVNTHEAWLIQKKGAH